MARKRHSSCNSTSLSEHVDSDEEETEVEPRKFSTRMKPRKLFKSNKPCFRKKGQYVMFKIFTKKHEVTIHMIILRNHKIYIFNRYIV